MLAQSISLPLPLVSISVPEATVLDSMPADAMDDVDDEQPIVAALLTILFIIEVGNVDNDDKLQACILPHIDRLL